MWERVSEGSWHDDPDTPTRVHREGPPQHDAAAADVEQTRRVSEPGPLHHDGPTQEVEPGASGFDEVLPSAMLPPAAPEAATRTLPRVPDGEATVPSGPATAPLARTPPGRGYRGPEAATVQTPAADARTTRIGTQSAPPPLVQPRTGALRPVPARPVAPDRAPLLTMEMKSALAGLGVGLALFAVIGLLAAVWRFL